MAINGCHSVSSVHHSVHRNLVRTSIQCIIVISVASRSSHLPTSVSRSSMRANPRSFEHLCARVTSNGSSCVALLIDRPNSVPVSSVFFNELSAMLEALATSSDPLIVTGDVNIRLDRPDDPKCQWFNELIDSFGFANCVSQPTYDRGDLDVLLTHCDLPAPPTTLIDAGLSDHLLIKWSTDLRVKPPSYTTSTRRPWSHLNVGEFRTALEESQLCDSVHLNTLEVDQLGSLYSDTVTCVLDRLIPVKTVTVRKRLSDHGMTIVSRWKTSCWTTAEAVQSKHHCRRQSNEPFSLTWPAAPLSSPTSTQSATVSGATRSTLTHLHHENYGRP